MPGSESARVTERVTPSLLFPGVPALGSLPLRYGVVLEEWSLNVGGVSSVVRTTIVRVDVMLLRSSSWPTTYTQYRWSGRMVGHDEQLPVVDPPVPSPGSASCDESPGSWQALTVSLFAVSAMILLAVVFPAETST